MGKPDSKVVKISMPYSFANQFIEESRINFYDSRWLNIAFKDKMYNALYQQTSKSIKERIEEVRQELIELIKEMYERCKNE